MRTIAYFYTFVAYKNIRKPTNYRIQWNLIPLQFLSIKMIPTGNKILNSSTISKFAARFLLFSSIYDGKAIIFVQNSKLCAIWLQHSNSIWQTRISIIFRIIFCHGYSMYEVRFCRIQNSLSYRAANWLQSKSNSFNYKRNL